MIDFATRAMLPGLKDIWMECFGDGREYTEFLFEHLLRRQHVLVSADRDETPMAMLCLEPFTLASPVGNQEGCYLFGVATKPEYQGRGLSTQLLEECHLRLAADGFALSALVPAGEDLFRFYGKRGYETAFHLVKAAWKGAEIPPAAHPCVLAPAALESLEETRDRFYADRSQFVRWERGYLAYIGKECAMLGGEVLRIGCEGEQGYGVCYRDGNRVIVKELALAEELLEPALAALHARYGAEEYQVYLPGDAPGFGKKVLPFAMVRWYDKEKQEWAGGAAGRAPWIAHVLD